MCYNHYIMKKHYLALLLAGLALTGTVQARQIVDRTNKFYINLPDRYLLEAAPTTDNKYVVMEAYDPDDESTFTIKISPVKTSELTGMALDNERTRFRDSLVKMGLDPYVEGILHMAPSHEAIYCFSKLDDNGEILNYLMAKFWAHNKEYSFFCIQPTKTLRTQEFLDSIDSFSCHLHGSASLPYPQRKERKEYEEAKDKHDLLVKDAKKEADKLIADGKKEEAEKILAAVPEFKELPPEYIPLVEINAGKPLPKNITDKVEHDALYSEHPEKVYAAAARIPKPNNEVTGTYIPAMPKKDYQNTDERDNKEEFKPIQVEPPTMNENREGITVIRNGKATQDYEMKRPPQRKLTPEEIKQMEKMKKEQEKFEKEQQKRQEKLDKLRKKELEKQRKKMEQEIKERNER